MLTLCNRRSAFSLVLALVFCITVGADTVLSRAEAADAAPQAASWRVLEAAGSVRYRLPGGDSWSRAEVGDVLPPGSRIVTDEAASLTVERSGETIIMRPSARLMLPPGYRTHRARQEAGSLSYHIARSQDRRFDVETPYASLVVKGTAFDVDVTEAGITVSVEDGRVEVTSRGGAAAELGAGYAARVSAVDHALEVRRSPDEPYVPIEPAGSTWFDRFLEAMQSALGGAPSADGGSTGGASGGGASVGGTSIGGTSIGGVSIGGGGLSIGGTSVGGLSIGGASIGGDGVSLGSTSVGGASIGGASIDSGGASLGGASVGGASVGGASIGRGGVSVGGVSVGGGGGTNGSASGGTSGGTSGSASGGTSGGGTSGGGVSVGGVSVGRGGVSVGGVSLGGRN